MPPSYLPQATATTTVNRHPRNSSVEQEPPQLEKPSDVLRSVTCYFLLPQGQNAAPHTQTSSNSSPPDIGEASSCLSLKIAVNPSCNTCHGSIGHGRGTASAVGLAVLCMACMIAGDEHTAAGNIRSRTQLLHGWYIVGAGIGGCPLLVSLTRGQKFLFVFADVFSP